MKIVADRNIVGVEAFFGSVVEVELVEGRSLHKNQLQNADALLVRSVTTVDQALLAQSPVVFVGTATAGLDHIDLEYLNSAGVGFSSAPGSNANSVVEYVISALANADGCLESLYCGSTMGVVGYGCVGSLLASRLTALGIDVVAYDPLIDQGSSELLTDFEKLLDCDVLSLHTPLTKGGAFPSFHQFNREVLKSLKKGALLLNAGRGGTVDNGALLELLQAGQELTVVLDVWEGEPDINVQLLQMCNLATPHISGYSYDGKLAATRVLFENFCLHFGIEGEPVSLQILEEPKNLKPASTAPEIIREVINQVYDITADDKKLRELLSVGDIKARAIGFDKLRKHYPRRREIASVSWLLDSSVTAKQKALLKALGCKV